MPKLYRCFVCNKLFEGYVSNPRIYCSQECFDTSNARGDFRKGKYLNCVICGKEFYAPPARVKAAKYCCFICRQIGEGRKGGATRGKQRQAESQGKAYKKRKGVHIHRLLAAEKLGRPLRPGEVVHHIDANKLNNVIENIEVFPSQAEHARCHVKKMLKQRKIKHGY